MSKLTSVEWLRDKIFEEFRFTFSDNILEQAKAIHKQEIMDAHNFGAINWQGGIDNFNHYNDDCHYYNETYNSSMSEIPTNSSDSEKPNLCDVNQELSEVVKNESYDVREDDVEKLATEWVDKNSHKWSNNTDEVGDNYGSFIAGYNKAKENTYTEEQVLTAMKFARTFSNAIRDIDYVQSLKK